MEQLSREDVKNIAGIVKAAGSEDYARILEMIAEGMLSDDYIRTDGSYVDVVHG